ncbi:hypothetical protein SAMN05216350_110101 [Polaromonas sp. YR568]|uniref:hypothetical protein n=1 Tax=Polaromonas sp. YR568 TaxID=1855301 RepID=UPI0008F41B10|nr:hypothetical protein [Polaromonas sp. YR568]SFU97927.1 hypothetical protein SAMN05216350_110101 [Polaromonas sp. YR568]
MNRCNSSLTPFLAALAASAGLLGLPALAQTEAAVTVTSAAASAATEVPVKPNVRQFPAKALRGELVVLVPPVISLDGKQDRLSVGARIRDVNNHFVLSGPLRNQKLVVNYVRNPGGLIQDIWILNAEEAKEKRAGNNGGTIFNITTGSDTTTPVDNGKTPYDQLPAYKQ